MYRSSSYDVSVPQKPQDSIQQYNGSMSKRKARDDDVPIVVVRNAYKSFNRNKQPVLEDFSMTVRKGTIYSLFGSSGCGKTTTLACIVGVQKLKSGSIFVFGSSGVSRSRVGYMPQDISLYGDFSIAENLNYFGTLCGMDQYFVASQIFYLTNLLGLPPANRRVGTLSGGQRRRVSFACSLIHEPELLLLDEPTTGVDPLLREKIWNHLISLTKTKKTTILLTTHYIDEAKPSQMVGVMRGGRLIAEESPLHLLERYNTTSLETVILNLCKERNPPPQVIEYYANYKEEEKKSNYTEEFGRRIKALVGKNTVIMLRNIFLLIFVTTMPAIISLVTGIAVQNDASSLKIGVVNRDTDFNSCFDSRYINPVEGECDLEQLGCKFLRKISNETIDLEHYETAEAAIARIEEGKLRGFISIPEDYTDSYFEWVTSGGVVDDYVLNSSQITIRLDKSNVPIAGVIEEAMYDALKAYSKQMLENCGFDPRQVESPLRYAEPIYGNEITTQDSVCPSIGILMILFFPMLSSSIRLIGEKKEGTLGRALVSGTNIGEIILAYTVTELLLIVAQGGLVMLVTRVVTGRDPIGSAALCLLIYIMVGVNGMSLGFMMGMVLTEEIEAGLLGMAIFLPNNLISGSTWPLESMPDVMKQISSYLPCTRPMDAIRSISNRGWSPTHPGVWPGFVISSVHICLAVIITLLIHKLKANL